MNMEEASPSGEHSEVKDKLTVFKKPSLIPSLSPSRNRKSMSVSKEDCHHLTADSTTSINEKSGGEKEERKHSFLQIFRKHQPPNSLDNLHSKSSSNRHKEEKTTPSSSLSFLQKLSSFHSNHSPSMPQSSNIIEEGRAVEQLFPLKEMDALESMEENALQPSKHPTEPDQIWSEPTRIHHNVNEMESHEDSAVEIRIQPPQSPSVERSSPFRRRSAIDEAANEREEVQQSLQACLENFRAGKMRSLTDIQVQKLRSMHEKQLHLTEQVMQMDGPLSDNPQDNERYIAISAKLSELHKQMDEFSLSTVF